MSKKEIKSLESKRDRCFDRLYRFYRFVRDFSESQRVLELETRLQGCEAIWNDFSNIQDNLEFLLMEVEGELEKQSKIREKFENEYFGAITSAKEKIVSRTPNPPISPRALDPSAQLPVIPSADAQLQSNLLKLPALSLPQFDGHYDKWLQFSETFEALINNNNSLSNVQRFYYLQSALKGEALQIIHSLQISEANYAVAWKLLRERYQNKRVIIQAHVKALFDVSPIGKESHTGLRQLLDHYLKHLRALESLGEPTSQWGTLVIHLICSKLDINTKREWESANAKDVVPTLEQFTEFLTERSRILEAIYDSSSSSANETTSNKFVYRSHGSFKRNDPPSSTRAHVVTNSIQCVFCRGPHLIYFCRDFLNLNPNSRYNEVKKLNICTNCLRRGHQTSQCRSSGCKVCDKRHNTRLHFDNIESVDGTRVAIRDDKPANSTINRIAMVDNTHHEMLSSVDAISSNLTTLNASNQGLKHEPYIMLSTAVVLAYNNFGDTVKCTALLDSGSQSNFVTRELLDRLKLPSQKVNIPVTGIDQVMTYSSTQTQISIQSRYSSYKQKLSFLILNKITEDIPTMSFRADNAIIPTNINLADPDFNRSKKVDMLLGANIFYDLLGSGQIKLGINQPVIQETILGWVLGGPILLNNKLQQTRTSCNLARDNLNSLMERFWSMEEVSSELKYIGQNECEAHFLNNFTRDVSGRFTVKLPMKADAPPLGESFVATIKRFKALETKLLRFPQMRKDYCQFMRDYENLGHMSKIPNENIKTHANDNTIFYLPHHGVLKETSLTTKLRVVYDASAKTSSNVSLNDILLVGPTIQGELFEILLRFRKHNFVIIADIEKMYRQVLIHPSQRDLQRIIWREDPEQDLSHYRLNTVTYGTAPASFLSTRCLHQLAHEHSDIFPLASKVIQTDMYVDDLITGSDTIEDAIKLQGEVSQILGSGGFNLRKWITNDQRILRHLRDNAHNFDYFITDDVCVKTLGMLWNSQSDMFKFIISEHDTQDKGTKRTILSTISKIFDPLGLVGPIVISAKIILQRLWSLQIGWDEAVPSSIHTKWMEFLKQINVLSKIEIPRLVLCTKTIEIQIHGFCDASEAAYGACVYLRTKTMSNKILVSLLCAKSRVSPLKLVTLPRLELCGALLLSKLTQRVINALNIKSIQNIYLWTDSTIVLHWLAAAPSTWKVFVAHRVSEIQTLSNDAQWNHVSSGDNPADLISRGVDPHNLMPSSIWWTGPAWLSQDFGTWPTNTLTRCDGDFSNVPEKRVINTNVFVAQSASDLNLFLRFSNLSKLQRVLCYSIRFVKNCLSQSDKRLTGSLTVAELDNALTILIKMSQSDNFSSDIRKLETSSQVAKDSKLKSLNPFLDKNKILRVGGRLENSSLLHDHKHPIILHNKHPLTRMLINFEHIRNLHAGAQGTLSAVRRRFWPLRGKDLVKGIIRQCTTCFRVSPKNVNPIMGDLPMPRVTPARVFYNCGIDFAGPFLLKDGKFRNRKIIKSYLCVFICFLTKAVHLELVGDLSTDSFLNALKRFVSRRGFCRNIFSDNGTNFLGAKNHLAKEFKILAGMQNEQAVDNFLSQNQIIWKCIPPRAPHFGGIWEAAVKSAKYHIKRIVGTRVLTFEHLYTIFSQVEAVLNSRPITPLSTDPNDLLALTPAHFLIGDTLTALPEVELAEIPSNRLSQYKVCQQVVEHFWKRWKNEYLSSLQQRNKWQHHARSPPVGSLVLLKDDITPPLKWPLARVVGHHAGKDGVVRVVTVKTNSGVFKRAVSRVCQLPSDDEIVKEDV